MAYHAPTDFAATQFSQWKGQVLGHIRLDYWTEIDPEHLPDISPRDAFNRGMSAGSFGDLINEAWDAAEERTRQFFAGHVCDAGSDYEAFLESRADERAGR